MEDEGRKPSLDVFNGNLGVFFNGAGVFWVSSRCHQTGDCGKSCIDLIYRTLV